MTEPAIKKYNRIPQFHFLAASRFEELKMGRLDHGGVSVYIGGLDELTNETEKAVPDEKQTDDSGSNSVVESGL